jgi:hypothetical protein
LFVAWYFEKDTTFRTKDPYPSSGEKVKRYLVSEFCVRERERERERERDKERVSASAGFFHSSYIFEIGELDGRCYKYMDMAPCSLVEGYRHVEETFCLHIEDSPAKPKDRDSTCL